MTKPGMYETWPQALGASLRLFVPVVLFWGMAGLLLFMLMGCSEPRVTSPHSGQPVTVAQLEAESRIYTLEQEAAERAEGARAEAELRRLEREAESRLRRLALAQEAEGLDAQQEIDDRLADVLDRRAVERSAREAGMAAMAAKFAAARADLDAQAEEQLAWIGGAQSALQQAGALVPGLGPLVGVGGVLLGGLGAITQRRRARRAEGQRDEAAVGARKIVDALDMLKVAEPAVAAAFKDKRQLIHEWLGAGGVKLVKQLRDADGENA